MEQDIITETIINKNLYEIPDGGYWDCVALDKRIGMYDPKWYEFKHGKITHKIFRNGDKVTGLEYYVKSFNK